MLMTILGMLGSAAFKAHAGGAATMLMQVIAGPGLRGFGQGLGGSIEEAGALLGAAVGSYILGFAITWFSPKNRG
jgi:hypothetical protein